MKTRYSRAELKRRFDAVYCVPANFTMIRYVIGEGSGYCDRVEGWACDVYPVADYAPTYHDNWGRVALTWGDAPKGAPLPDAFCRLWEKRGRRIYDSVPSGRFTRLRRLRGAFFRAVGREFGVKGV